MKIILSPAKTMVKADDDLAYRDLPVLMKETEHLLAYMKSLSMEELKKVFRSSDKIVRENYERYRNMNLREGLSPAVFSYTGLAYKHMAPSAMTDAGLSYLQEHLRIISGFYGILKPFDGVTPYRLEMQSVLPGHEDLYAFWKDKIYHALQDDLIINLASAEYSSAVAEHLSETDRMITVIFAEKKNGKLIQKGTYAKMLRGEMVYWMAENDIRDPSLMKEFNTGCTYSEEDSEEDRMVFLIHEGKGGRK